MRYLISSVILLSLLYNSSGQSDYYYPPATGEWEEISSSDLGYDEDLVKELLTFLEDRNTNSFIILKGGKIAVEAYFGTYTADSSWYWASSAKSLTAALIGIAQEEDLLSIQDQTNAYIGEGWTSLSLAQENKIKIVHQLSMTTGLEWKVPDMDCVDPECLQYRSEPNSEWFYHNAPYLLLTDVIESASGSNINFYSRTKLFNKIGMKGFWFDNLLFSRARDMARFGHLMLSEGKWNGEDVLADKAYLSTMITNSQSMNPAYGYLWWLNGTENFIQPGLPMSFSGSIIPSAPRDLYAALGKNDQKIYVVPSLDLVVIRQGDKAVPEAQLAVSGFDDELWEYIMALEATKLFTPSDENDRLFFPSPAGNYLYFTEKINRVEIYDLSGKSLAVLEVVNQQADISMLAPGTYIVHLENKTTPARKVLIKE